MSNFARRALRFGWAAAILGPLLFSMPCGQIGHQAGLYFKWRQINATEEWFLVRLFLGQNRLWTWILIGQSIAAASVCFAIHRSGRSLEWKLAATICIAIASLLLVCLVFFGCEMAVVMHLMRSWEKQVWGI